MGTILFQGMGVDAGDGAALCSGDDAPSIIVLNLSRVGMDR